VQTGDIIVVIGLTQDSARLLSTPTGGSLTYTLQQSVIVAAYSNAYVWTATATSNATFTISVAATGTGLAFGTDIQIWRGSAGVGASSKTNAAGAPSLALTTSYANSAVCVGNADWNAVDGASRTWRQVGGVSPTEAAYQFYTGSYTVYAAYHPDAGAAGSKTVGLSAPTGQAYSTIAVEIRGAAAAGYGDIYTMGSPLKVLGAPSNAWEIEYSGVNPVVAGDGTITTSAPSGATAYRSEVIFVSDGSDGLDYTNFRFVEGQRIHIAFDVKTSGLNAQDSGNWNSVWQSLGPATAGNWPYTPLTILIENSQWVIQGGQAITLSELTPRTAHQDGVWTRWELNILLGRAGTGSVSIWKDGVQIANAWQPTSGTYYAGTGNSAVDLQWMYFKNGLYGGATTSPQAVSAVFHNRRFSAVSVDGLTTTTWIGPTQANT
jgi:hypothetical protein